MRPERAQEEEKKRIPIDDKDLKKCLHMFHLNGPQQGLVGALGCGRRLMRPNGIGPGTPEPEGERRYQRKGRG